jgi:hypothetical protein
MKRSLVVGPLGALALLACVVASVRACSCIANDFYAAFAVSDAVFLGVVLEISSPAPELPCPVSVTVRVEQEWKESSAPSTTYVLTASNEAACGFPFRVGKRYLIYANRGDGALWATLCSRTHETSPVDPDLDLLASPLPPLVLVVGPNPSVSSVRLAWTTFGGPVGQATAHLEVLDFQGRRIRTLVDGRATAGHHESLWDGRDEQGHPTPSGIYWARLEYGDRVACRRLVRTATRH